MTTSMEIDLVQPLIQQAQTPKQKHTSPLRAHALVQWLLTHHFPSKIRKSSLPVSVTSLIVARYSYNLQMVQLKELLRVVTWMDPNGKRTYSKPSEKSQSKIWVI